MLRKILSIAGRPGLFRLVSQGKNMLIVEDIISGKRMPAHSRDRISSLGDISIYTQEGDTPLGNVLASVYEKTEGKEVDVKAIDTPEGLREYFGGILPEFDIERVHLNDIRKLLSWYNLLVRAGITEFVEPEEKEDTQ